MKPLKQSSHAQKLRTQQAAVMDNPFLLNLLLNDLDNPYKCAKWMSELPRRKPYYLSVLGVEATQENGDDITCCNRISQFIYQQQMDGKSFAKGYTEDDFQDMLTNIFSSRFEYENCRWIWQVIHHLQQKQGEKRLFNLRPIGWIQSSWTRLTIVETESDCDYHQPACKDDERDQPQTAIKRQQLVAGPILSKSTRVRFTLFPKVRFRNKSNSPNNVQNDNTQTRLQLVSSALALM